MWSIESNLDRSRVKLTFASVLTEEYCRMETANTRQTRKFTFWECYLSLTLKRKENTAWSQTASPCVLNVKCRSTDMFSMSCTVWGMQSVSEGDLINTDIAMWLLCIHVCVCMLQYSICSPCGEWSVEEFSQESTRNVWIINSLLTSTEFWESASDFCSC